MTHRTYIAKNKKTGETREIQASNVTGAALCITRTFPNASDWTIPERRFQMLVETHTGNPFHMGLTPFRCASACKQDALEYAQHRWQVGKSAIKSIKEIDIK